MPCFGSALASLSSFPLPCPVPLQAVLSYEIKAFCLLGDPRFILLADGGSGFSMYPCNSGTPKVGIM